MTGRLGEELAEKRKRMQTAGERRKEQIKSLRADIRTLHDTIQEGMAKVSKRKEQLANARKELGEIRAKRSELQTKLKSLRAS